jgi:DNA-binding transcriptional LysR family regulator
VVETGGFSSAARQLGLAQPTVHRAVRDIEALCGEPLCRRTTGGVEPTLRAVRLARHAGLALLEIRHGLEEVAELDGQRRSRIRVGCLPLARVQILPDAVNATLERHPELAISIVDGPYDELLRSLRHGTLDLVIGALREPAPSADVVQETLFHDPLAIVVRAGHPVLRVRARGAVALAKLSWIVPRSGTPARSYFNAYFRAHGVPTPRRCIECSSLVATRGLLLGSDRAALLSARQVRLELAARQLALVLDPLPGTARPIGLTTRRDWKPTPAIADLLAELRQAAAKR